MQCRDGLCVVADQGISPSVCGCTGLGARSWFRRRATSGRRVVEVVVGVDPEAAGARCRGVAAGENPIWASCVCGVAQSGGEQRARVVEGGGNQPRAGGCPSVTRRSASGLSAELGGRSASSAGSAGNGPAGARSASGPIEMPTSVIAAPLPAPGTRAVMWRWSFRCLPTWGSRVARNADCFELLLGLTPESRRICGEPSPPRSPRPPRSARMLGSSGLRRAFGGSACRRAGTQSAGRRAPAGPARPARA